MDTDEITEITEADFTKVAGVTAPANRTPFIMLKARDQEDAAPEDEASTEDKFKENAAAVAAGGEPTAKGKDGEGEPHDADTSSQEAKEIEAELTKATVYCGDPECEDCQKATLIPYTVFTAHASGVSKATLRAADRKKMPAGQFAYVDPEGGKHLPIHDEAHTQAAMGRFSQQDFSGAKDPAKAKQKAAGKIKAAAGKFGMSVDDESDVAQAAKGAIQDALGGTRAPEVAGVVTATGVSSVGGPATGEVKEVGSITPDNQQSSSVPGVIGRLRGGESAYEIPAVERAYTVRNAEPTGTQVATADLTKAGAVASLMEAMAKIDEQRQAVKDGRYLQVPGPGPAAGDAASAPSSMPWENYDAATLDQVAAVLAQCCNAVECIATREQIEALSGDAGDQADAWDLGCAADCLDQAMGIVARLAYAEGAEAQKSEGDIKKAYRRLLAGDEKALRDAHAALSNVLAEHDRKVAEPSSSEPSEGDKIQMELTKEELADQIAASTKQEIAAALKAERKAVKKQAAKAAEKAKKAAKKQAQRAAFEAALKNANNNGDITAQELADGVSSEQDANEIQSVGGKVQAKYVNKQIKKALKKAAKDATLAKMGGQLEALSTDLSAVGQQVQKFAQRPRSGGPVLDGIPRGSLFLGNEQRVGGGQVAKSGADQEIEKLEKQLEDAKSDLERQDVGFRLTQLRLAKAHEQGDSALPILGY